MSEPVRRPVGVTIIVVLIVLAGVLNIVAGVLTFIQRNNLEVQDTVEMTGGEMLWFSMGVTLLGVVYLLIAGGLAQGGGFARFLVAIVTVLNLLAGIYVAIFGDGRLRNAGLVQIVIALVVLLLLYSRRANEFFRAN